MSEPSVSYRPRRAARAGLVTLRGRRFGLMSWGPADAAPVLMLHGWLDCAAAWQLLVDELPDSWHCLALDWSGYGASEWRPDGYCYAHYFADLEALLAQIAPAGAQRVIAHSLGGTIASMYAGIRPGRLRWLANLEGFGLPDVPVTKVPGRIAQWLDAQATQEPHGSYPDLTELVGRIRQANPGLDAAAAGYLAQVWAEPAPRGGWRLRCDPRHRDPSPIRYQRAEIEACWAQAALPLLLLGGECSQFRAGPGAAEPPARWAALFPRAQVQVAGVGNAGHLLHYEQPHAVARLIAAFAAGVEQ